MRHLPQDKTHSWGASGSQHPWTSQVQASRALATQLALRWLTLEALICHMGSKMHEWGC